MRVSGFRYTPLACFDPFPFPWPPSHEPKDSPLVNAIAEAARELVAEARCVAESSRRKRTGTQNPHANQSLQRAPIMAGRGPSEARRSRIRCLWLARYAFRCRTPGASLGPESPACGHSQVKHRDPSLRWLASPSVSELFCRRLQRKRALERDLARWQLPS